MPSPTRCGLVKTVECGPDERAGHPLWVNSVPAGAGYGHVGPSAGGGLIMSELAREDVRAERYTDAQHRIAQVRCAESSRDGSLRVTVDSAGALTDLRIADSPYVSNGQRLAAEILATIRRAQSHIPERIAEILRTTVGDETELTNTVVSTFSERYPASEEDPSAPDATNQPAPRRRAAQHDEPDDDDYFGGGVLRP
ncbi:MAG: hypothetical protein GEU98_23905 [Pseudonocardiaceae bacterium]|nr:hypothetical protein [Pseudonocardiaceae bacterium]